MSRDITLEVMKALETLGAPVTAAEVYLALSGQWIRGRGIIFDRPLINEGPRDSLNVYATLQGLVRARVIKSDDVYYRSMQNYGSTNLWG
jgi:hypothetical protein